MAESQEIEIEDNVTKTIKVMKTICFDWKRSPTKDLKAKLEIWE